MCSGFVQLSHTLLIGAFTNADIVIFVAIFFYVVND